MILISGLDSSSAPTLAQVQSAKAAGVVWWGFYLPRLPNTDPLNGWTVQQMDVLNEGGVIPVPICVPAPPAPADPVVTATEYLQLCHEYGLEVDESVCYNGEHISVTGSVWLPVPGPAPTAIGAGSAIQYMTGTWGGLAVDFNKSTPDFPTNKLVCDLEHGAAYTSEWYATFQSTVAQGADVPLSTADINAIVDAVRPLLIPAMQSAIGTELPNIKAQVADVTNIAKTIQNQLDETVQPELVALKEQIAGLKCLTTPPPA